MANFVPRHYAKILYELTAGLSASDMEKAVREYVKMLIEKQVFTKTDAIITAFYKYVKEKEGIREAEVVTARKLGKEDLANIIKVLGEKIEITQQIDASLIGGIKIKVGDTIIDGSVQKQLNMIQEKLS